MVGTNVALHEHLSTNKYRGEKWVFDEVIDIAKKRLGNNGVLVVSGFADGRLVSDRRYETFVDRPSKRYSKNDLDGRATLVQGKGTSLLVVNGLEAEFGEGIDSGSLLVMGLERDGGLKAGRDVNHNFLLGQLPEDSFSFYVHPFHHGGSGPFLDKVLRERGAEPYLAPVDGVEVFNAQACLPVPGYFNANHEAVRFFYRAVKEGFRLSPVKGSDGHSLWELGNVFTVLPVKMDLEKWVSWHDAYVDMKVRFEYNEKCPVPESLYGTGRDSLCGVLGATKHAFALAVGRKLGFPKKEDW